jgi:hypothetical protein
LSKLTVCRLTLSRLGSGRMTSSSMTIRRITPSRMRISRRIISRMPQSIIRLNRMTLGKEIKLIGITLNKMILSKMTVKGIILRVMTETK